MKKILTKLILVLSLFLVKNLTVNGQCNNPPTPTISGGPTFCGNGTLDAGSYSSYLWNTGATTETLLVSSTGPYDVTVTDGNGCTGTASIAVTVNPLPTVSAGNDVTICLGSSITLIASGADSYVWDNNINNTNTVPLDNVSGANLALGLRKLNSSYNGNALQLRRSSDNATSDFGFVGNDLDLASITAWLNGATGYCTILYDQSGNGGDVTQTDPNRQPSFVSGGINGNPTLHFNTSQFLSNNTNYPPPFTVVYGARETGGSRQRVLSAGNNNWLLGFWGGNKQCAYFDGWVAYPNYAGDNSFYVYSGASDGSVSQFYENSSLIANNSGGVSGPNGIELNGIGHGGEMSDCDFSDVMIFGSVLSDNDRGSVESSISTYQNPNELTVSPASTTTYSVVGTTNGCSSSATITVSVVTTPEITSCPSDISQEVFGNDCSSVITYPDAVATQDAVITYSQNSGTTFNNGTTTVVVTATNACSFVSCSFVVNVYETTPPVITCPSDITINNTPGQCYGTTDLTNADASDNCTVQSLTNNVPSTYPIGNTVVTWTATDISGNTATCSQNVTVVQDIPVITCPSNMNISTDDGQCVATGVTYSATNNCGIAGFDYNPPSGSTFNPGTTTVNVTATDGSGNTATCSFTVTVADQVPPVITGCTNITANADQGNCSTVVTFSGPTATDNCSPAYYVHTFSYTGSTSTFTVPSGITSLSISAWGAAGGGGGNDGQQGGHGGGGAYSTSILTVNPGDVLTLFVGGGGGGGLSCAAGYGGGSGGFGYGNGGIGGNAGYYGCSGSAGGGGGATAILNGNTLLVIAAGGGGGGGGGNDAPSGAGGSSDAGGGSTNNSTGGLAASSGSNNGAPGTDRGFGDGGAGGGGGGGLQGGDGGGAPNCDCSGGGGGGGSSLGTVTEGSGSTPGNYGLLSSYCSGCGTGGSINQTGGNGYLIIAFLATNPPIAQIAGLSSGSSFPVGTTTNVYTSADANGNTSSCSFTITVNDIEAPVMTSPANVTVNNDAGNCSAVVTYNLPDITDNCSLGLNQTFSYTGSIQSFEVPAGINSLTITAVGAQGGPSYNGGYRGLGASMTGTVSVTLGQVLKVLVGGQGNIGYNGGGGGGSFVTDNSNNPLVIAGGGGGANFDSNNGYYSTNNADANTTTSGHDGINGSYQTTAGIGGTNGNGGGADYYMGYYVGAGGGGLTGDGENGFGSSIGGSSFINGGAGGASCGQAGSGGFGGGGGADWCYYTGAGGGGGYSGGGGGSNYGVGGGGGSYNAGTNQNNVAGVGTGNGSVIFTYNVVPSLMTGLTSGSTFPVGSTINTFSVSDLSGNTATASFTVTVVDNEVPALSCPSNITVTPNHACSAVVTFSVSATDNCGISSIVSSTASGSTFSNGTTVVTNTATDVNGNSSTCSFSVTIIGSAPAQPGAITGNTSVCHGSVQTYSISPVSSTTGYIWTIPAGWTGSSTTTSITVTTGNTGGNVIVKASNGCGNSPQRTLGVSVIPNPGQPGVITGNTTICSGTTQTYSIASVNGATSYTWTLPSGWSGTSTTTSITVTSGTAGGNIIVKANNACGSSANRTLFVTVTALPATPGTISGNNSVCSGTTQTYTIAAVNGATSYLWILPSGWSGSSTSTSISTTVGNSSGNVSVLSVNNCGTSITTRTLAVNISSAPAQPGAITGSTSVCQGTSHVYSISAVTGATSYTWTLPSGWSGTSTTTSIIAIAGSLSGTISVIANNSCGTSAAQTLSVTTNSIPQQPGTISGNTSVCKSSVQTYSISPVTGATSYTWTLPSGWTGTSTTTSITCTIGIVSGNITVKVSNSCGNSPIQILAVSVNSITQVTITSNPANSNYCAQVTPLYIQLMASGGYTSYAWTPSGGNTQTATVSSVNTFMVTATNAAGCTMTASKSVTNNCALPTSLSTSNITGTTAKANWVQSQCRFNYTIRISVHGLNTWTPYTINPSTSYTFTGLSLGTSYDWEIQTNCNTSGSINSGWSAMQTFTTLSSRMADEENGSTSFNIYPNPANEMVTITFSSMIEGTYNIKMTDMLGRVVKSEVDNASIGENSYIMNLDGIAKGVYMVILQKGDNISKSKIVVE